MQNTVINNIQKNQNLKDILEQNGIIFNEDNFMINIEEIGSGISSTIYEIKDTNKVLKISDNRNEFYGYEKLIEAFEEDSSIKNYFEIPLILAPINKSFYQQIELSDISYNNQNPRYYFILNKLNKLDDNETKIFEDILKYYNASDISEIIIDYENEIDEDDEYIMDHLIENGHKYIDNEMKNIWEFFKIIFSYCEEYEFFDIHVDNIMKDNQGNYKVIDIRTV